MDQAIYVILGWIIGVAISVPLFPHFCEFIEWVEEKYYDFKYR